MPRPLRSVHNSATESKHMTHRQDSSASAPHHAIPTRRALGTPEILSRIEAMFADPDDPGTAGTDPESPPT